MIAILGSSCAKSGGGPGAIHDDSQIRSYLVDGFSSLRQVEYKVDGSLDLQMIRHVRVELFPQTLGPPVSPNSDADPLCERQADQQCNRPRFSPLRSGIYRLRYALIRNGYENAEEAYRVLDAGEIKAQVSSGFLVADLALKLINLSLIASRNHLLIEISSLDDSNLVAGIFETALDSSAASRLIFAPFDVHRINQNFSKMTDVLLQATDQEQTEAFKKSKIQSQYITSQNLVEWPSTQKTMSLVPREALLAAMETKKVDFTLYNSLCELWATQVLPNLEHERFQIDSAPVDTIEFMQNCTQSRDLGVGSSSFFHRLGFRDQPFFIFQNIYDVEAAQIKDQKSPGRNLTLQVTDKFYVRSRLEFNAEAGLRPLSWVPLVGSYLSLAGTLSIDKSLKEDEGNELRFQTNMQLNVEQNSFGVQFEKYRRCLVIRMNPAHVNDAQVTAFSDTIATALGRDQMKRAMTERGLLVCDDRATTPVIKRENYYYVYAGKNEGLQQDAADIRNREVLLPLRGERDFQAFLQAGKSRLDNPETTTSDYGGITSALGRIEESIASISPAAPGVYVDAIFF
jgi:hypothetical protein